MAEDSVRSYDPLAYYVNSVVDLNSKLVTAYKKKDNEAIKVFLSQGINNFDIYICVHKSWHAFVLCTPIGEDHPVLDDDTLDDPFKIPSKAFCWVYELCYENIGILTYKIKKEFTTFDEIEQRIKKSYYLGRYRKTSAYGLELAALRAAPTRYNVLLEDCVEFAKAMCEELLAYCGNYEELKKSVPDKIKKATATGLSIEKLSRGNKSSGWFGNSMLGGVSVSSFLAGRHSGLAICVLVLFVLIYPIVVTIIIVYLFK